MAKKKCVVFDLDGTLCDLNHRLKYIKCFPKQSERFHSSCVGDTLIPRVFELYEMFRNSGYAMVILTCRPKKYEHLTIEWLETNGVKYDVLISSDKQELTDDKAKKFYKEHFIEPEYEIAFAVDDRKMVIDMWREEGITCLDVAGNTH